MRGGFGYYAVGNARVAELVDARDLKSLGVMHRAGSIPAPGTNEIDGLSDNGRFFESAVFPLPLEVLNRVTSSNA